MDCSSGTKGSFISISRPLLSLRVISACRDLEARETALSEDSLTTNAPAALMRKKILKFYYILFAIWVGPKDTLLEFLDVLSGKTDRIKLTYCISDSSISFLDLFLHRDKKLKNLISVPVS